MAPPCRRAAMWLWLWHGLFAAAPIASGLVEEAATECLRNSGSSCASAAATGDILEEGDDVLSALQRGGSLKSSSRQTAIADSASTASSDSGVAAGLPKDTLTGDMLGVHDLLLLGFWGVMTEGPQMNKELKSRTERVKEHKNGTYTYLETLYKKYGGKLQQDGAKEFPGLLQAQRAAIDLAFLVEDVHPWRPCRTAFARNVKQWKSCRSSQRKPKWYHTKWKRCDYEELVTVQAAEAWACVGVTEDMIEVKCGGSAEDQVKCDGKPITSLRVPKGPGNPQGVRQVDRNDPYKNYVIDGSKVDSPLGVCWQGAPEESGYASGKTKWLRACSYWTAFHSMALRADALGGDLPNQLFGTIIRLISGGALWCGG